MKKSLAILFAAGLTLAAFGCTKQENTNVTTGTDTTGSSYSSTTSGAAPTDTGSYT